MSECTHVPCHTFSMPCNKLHQQEAGLPSLTPPYHSALDKNDVAETGNVVDQGSCYTVVSKVYKIKISIKVPAAPIQCHWSQCCSSISIFFIKRLADSATIIERHCTIQKLDIFLTKAQLQYRSEPYWKSKWQDEDTVESSSSLQGHWIEAAIQVPSSSSRGPQAVLSLMPTHSPPDKGDVADLLRTSFYSISKFNSVGCFQL